MALVLAGCPEEPLITDYDATCEVDDDCALVVDQGYCGRCESWGALNADAADEFEADQERFGRRVRCGGSILIGCVPPEPPEVACDGGACVTLVEW